MLVHGKLTFVKYADKIYLTFTGKVHGSHKVSIDMHFMR